MDSYTRLFEAPLLRCVRAELSAYSVIFDDLPAGRFSTIRASLEFIRANTAQVDSLISSPCDADGSAGRLAAKSRRHASRCKPGGAGRHSARETAFSNDFNPAHSEISAPGALVSQVSADGGASGNLPAGAIALHNPVSSRSGKSPPYNRTTE